LLDIKGILASFVGKYEDISIEWHVSGMFAHRTGEEKQENAIPDGLY